MAQFNNEQTPADQVAKDAADGPNLELYRIAVPGCGPLENELLRLREYPTDITLSEYDHRSFRNRIAAELIAEYQYSEPEIRERQSDIHIDMPTHIKFTHPQFEAQIGKIGGRKTKHVKLKFPGISTLIDCRPQQPAGESPTSVDDSQKES